MALSTIPRLIDPLALEGQLTPPRLGTTALEHDREVGAAVPGDEAAIAGLLRAAAPDCIPQPPALVRERLPEFEVVRCRGQRADGQVVATAAVHSLDARRAELRGLAVDPRCRVAGLGRTLVQRAILRAVLAEQQLVCVTLSPGFFSRLGFCEIPLSALPDKQGRPRAPGGRPRVAMIWRPAVQRAREQRGGQLEARR